MIDAALRDSLSVFDDAALATLANAGLVRRAHRDVADGRVLLVSHADGIATLEADGQRVTMDSRGPKLAECSCRTITVCRHRIAAVLFLLTGPVAAQGAVQNAEGVGAEEAEAAEGEGDPDPVEQLATISLVALERWAGKAAWRAAIELADTAGQVEVGRQLIAVTFPEINGPVRILRGQGADGILSKVSKARAKAYHAAAVLAARRHAGMETPLRPEEADSDVDVSRDLMIDPAFMAKVEASLADVAALGFNLAPLPVEESLFELSVSSRADHLPRLAALLRAIAAQMRLRRSRSLDFDPDRLLELVASAFALIRALDSADGDRKLLLAGKVRRDFADADVLELYGVGGECWASNSGARGVTAWFVEPASGRWMSTTLARGAGQDPAFSISNAWERQVLWQCAPLAKLSHAHLRIHGARCSADHRISALASTRAEVIKGDIRPQAGWPGVVDRWDELPEIWLAQSGLGIDMVERTSACLIAPAAIAPPHFDDIAQQLVWPVQDCDGQWLALTLDHEGSHSISIEALEAHVRTVWNGMVLVRIEREGDRLALHPITIFGQDGKVVDLSLWQRPWSEGARGPALASVQSWLVRMRSRSTAPLPRAARSPTMAALAAAWRLLLDRVEVGPTLSRTLDDDLFRQAQRLDDFGMPTVAALLRSAADGGLSLLAAAYAVTLARQQRCEAPMLG